MYPIFILFLFFPSPFVYFHVSLFFKFLFVLICMYLNEIFQTET